ncbi:MAG: nickel-responsive transcriptional regulator NikR [Candidatus Hydrogenedentota bacterium]|nr:MAG: nickel-responsive transcriptional regulator NikR [Candidatus Hydrogenedentota bacterium]
MSKLVRLTFTIEEALNRKMEKLLKKGRFTNRSEFIRDLIRSRMVESEWEKDSDALGTITLVYDHDQRQLSDRLTSIQHQHHHEVLATTHVHLDNHLCAEMIMVKGRAKMIRDMADTMGQQKGVLHSSLSMSSTGKQLK